MDNWTGLFFTFKHIAFIRLFCIRYLHGRLYELAICHFVRYNFLIVY